MAERSETTVGERIRQVRERAGLSLQELADRTGYTSALLNQVENHLVSPPLGALGKIAHALGVPLGELWGEDARDPYTIVRKGESRQVSRFASREGVSYGYTYESLGFGKKDRHIEPFLITLEPPTVPHPKPSVHEGEEFLLVLEGRMEVHLAGHTDVLEPGDSILYDASLPHRVTCHGDQPAKVLAVIWQPE
ncbi:MAG: cupin domain-containing protein [Candidatus Dadabacteria bacterium]|nr:MAG: cupin domain-containing protein [Candidatus Dadabacteria bacterium]